MKAKLLTLAAAAVLLSGCGSSADEGELAYEQPLNTMRLAMDNNDEESYMSVFLPWEKKRFLSEERQEGFLADAYDRKAYDGKLSLKITTADVMSGEDLKELCDKSQERYGVHPEFSKGMIVTGELRVRKDGELFSDPKVFRLVRLENNWYICGETIESFSFSAS